MGWRAPPRREHDEGVVDADPEQEEGGGKVQRDELHLRIRDMGILMMVVVLGILMIWIIMMTLTPK